jgi:outer membrane protein OmpA-like peptidoglycan-associated protein
MTTSLIDSLNGFVTPDLTSRLASSLNEPGHAISTGLTGGMASLLTGILSKCGDPTALQSVYETVTNSANDGHVLDDPASFVGSGQTTPMTSLGGQFISQVFGNRADAVTNALSSSSGLHASSVTSLMQFAAPLVLGVLGKRIRDEGLNLSAFSDLLGRERDSIQRVTPSGVASALGMKEFSPAPDYEVSRAVAPEADVRPRVRRPEPEKRSSWVLPTVAVLAALALMWGVTSRSHKPSTVAYQPPPTTISGGEVAMPSASGNLRLRNGVILLVPSTSAESKLVAFLSDEAHGANSATWVVLDRMQFETNSAKLATSSDDEIQNLAKILKAYPQATVRIGGYTDNVGSPAANLRLSRARAESVRDAIVKNGVASYRVNALGFGERNPIASNSTEEGRAQNRRISMLVTAK